MDKLIPKLLAFPPNPPPPQPLSIDEYDRLARSSQTLLDDTPVALLAGQLEDGGTLLDVKVPLHMRRGLLFTAHD
jgi:hypothetical protein